MIIISLTLTGKMSEFVARKASILSPGTDILLEANLFRKFYFVMKIATPARLVIYAPKVQRRFFNYHLERNMRR